MPIKSKAPLRGRNAGSQIKNIFGGLAKRPVCGSTMSLLDKGKRGYTYMACSKARVGAGCRYKSVRYERVEKSFIQDVHSLQIPVGEQHLDVRWDSLNEELDFLHSYRAELLEGLANGKPKAVMTKMIRDAEAQIEQLESQFKDMMPEIVSRRERLTDLNIARMKEACRENPLDRAKLDTLLRQLLKGVVIDYQRGELDFQWKHGGESSMIFAWPEEEAKAQVKTV